MKEKNKCVVIDETGTAKPIVGSKVSELVARDKNSKDKLAAIGGAYYLMQVKLMAGFCINDEVSQCAKGTEDLLPESTTQ